MALHGALALTRLGASPLVFPHRRGFKAGVPPFEGTQASSCCRVRPGRRFTHPRGHGGFLLRSWGLAIANPVVSPGHPSHRSPPWPSAPTPDSRAMDYVTPCQTRRQQPAGRPANIFVASTGLLHGQPVARGV